MIALYTELESKKQEYHKAGLLHHESPNDQTLLRRFKTAKEAYHRVKIEYKHTTGEIPQCQTEQNFETLS